MYGFRTLGSYCVQTKTAGAAAGRNRHDRKRRSKIGERGSLRRNGPGRNQALQVAQIHIPAVDCGIARISHWIDSARYVADDGPVSAIRIRGINRSVTHLISAAQGRLPFPKPGKLPCKPDRRPETGKVLVIGLLIRIRRTRSDKLLHRQVARVECGTLQPGAEAACRPAEQAHRAPLSPAVMPLPVHGTPK